MGRFFLRERESTISAFLLAYLSDPIGVRLVVYVPQTHSSRWERGGRPSIRDYNRVAPTIDKRHPREMSLDTSVVLERESL